MVHFCPTKHVQSTNNIMIMLSWLICDNKNLCLVEGVPGSFYIKPLNLGLPDPWCMSNVKVNYRWSVKTFATVTELNLIKTYIVEHATYKWGSFSISLAELATSVLISCLIHFDQTQMRATIYRIKQLYL